MYGFGQPDFISCMPLHFRLLVCRAQQYRMSSEAFFAAVMLFWEQAAFILHTAPLNQL